MIHFDASRAKHQTTERNRYSLLACMDNGHVMRAFFKNIPNNWPIWADGEKNCGLFPIELSCVPSS